MIGHWLVDGCVRHLSLLQSVFERGQAYKVMLTLLLYIWKVQFFLPL